MARSTFKVLFYVNGSKERNGIVPIMGRVTINGTVAQFSCKQSVPKTLWDIKGNRAKGKSKEARDIIPHRRAVFVTEPVSAYSSSHFWRIRIFRISSFMLRRYGLRFVYEKKKCSVSIDTLQVNTG